MRSTLGYVAAALVLLLVGGGSWMLGRLDERVVDARRQLLTLQYEAPLGEYDRVERSVGSMSQLPWVADLVGDVRAQRATSKYWRADYASLSVERGAGGAIADGEPLILLLSANAAFRRTRLDGTDRSAVDRLNAVLEEYAGVLRREPQLFDAAYNYELVVRVRDGLTRSQPVGAAPKSDRSAAATIRSGQTIHGRPGGPPPGTDKS